MPGSLIAARGPLTLLALVRARRSIAIARRFLALTALCFAAAPWAQQPVPELAGRIVDLTGTLSDQQIDAFEIRLAALEQSSGAQVAVLLVSSTEPEPIETYALRVVEAWQLGREDVDDGVLLLVAKDDRRLRIEVGYGLEGAIPDAIANRIIDERIVPRFYAEDYAAGIEAGIDAIIASIEDEPLPAPAARPEAPGDAFGALPVLAISALFLAPLFRRLFGAAFGATAVGGIAGFVAWLIAGTVLAALAIGFIVFMLALGGRGSPGFWVTGRRGWGGMGRGGLGGGGFRGGGGGFGGGGASGRW